jgi:hypothetical protein
LAYYAEKKDTIKKSDVLILKKPIPVRYGLERGSSDLIGFTSIEILPEMVGQKIAVFTAIEVKSDTGKLSPEQENFINMVNHFGGIAGMATCVDEAREIIKKKASN